MPEVTPEILTFFTNKEIKLYPEGSSGVAITPGAQAYGSWFEVVPANTITKDFLITALIINHRPNLGDMTRYFLVDLGKGNPGYEEVIATVRSCQFETVPYASTGQHMATEIIPFSIPRKIEANMRVAARAAQDEVGHGIRPVNVLIQYIELPLFE
jgi:hypothetical protein